MASLTGQLVAETYKALLKTIDNDILTASEKQITDGFGGGSNVFIDSQGFLRANKYKVTNGLATQFLKADGSLDSNTYLTGITSSQIITALGYTPVTSARTLTINGTTYDLSANRSWTVAGTAAVWGNISGTLSDQTDLQTALNAKYNNPAGTISQYIRGDGSLATFPTISGGLPTGGTAGQILAKIDATDYNTHWIDNYATQTKNEVKLGATLAKGAAVYVSSANGTNMIVSAASNTSEATSSKTFGLLETGGATNDLVKCVTFGLLAGLDTSTAQAGDPVWLGVNGALIFGLANKPVAPAHMVYIGVVTRVQSNNGEIFVNVQNGFEIEELHDVLIQSKANNQGLFYESSTGLWKNKSIATVLGYTPQAELNGTGFVKASGTTISYDNSTYLTTTDADSTYQRLSNLSSNLNPSTTRYPSINAVIAGLDLKLDLTGGTLTGSITATSFVKTGGTSVQYLKADGSVAEITGDIVSGAGSSGYVPKWTSAIVLGSSILYDNGTSMGIGSTNVNYHAYGRSLTGSGFASNSFGFEASSAATTNGSLIGGLSMIISGNDSTRRIGSAIQSYISGSTATNLGADLRFYAKPDNGVLAEIVRITSSLITFNKDLTAANITATSFVKSGGTASEFLMADGSVSTLSSPVTGSGSAGYIPKWTTAANIGSSNIYDDGTSIGIAYSTPNKGGYGRTLTGAAFGSASFGFEAVGGTTTNGGLIGGLSFILSQNDSSRIVGSAIQSNLVGTTATNYGADLRFFAKADAGVIGEVARMTSAGLRVYGTIIKDGGTSSQFLMADGSVTTGVANPVGGTGTTGYIPKWTSGSVIGNSNISDNGSTVNVGINSLINGNIIGSQTNVANIIGGGFGTTTLSNNQSVTAGAVIGVYGGLYGFIDLAATADVGCWIDFSKGNGTDYAGRIRYDNLSDRFDFYTAGGATKVSISSAGNLLVNTTTDSGYKIETNGQIRSYSGSAMVLAQSSIAANDAVVAARWSSTSGIEMRYNPDIALTNFDSLYPATSGQVFGDIRFRVNAGGVMTPVMTIKANGTNVGIGTTSPTEKLHVYSSATTGEIRLGGGNGAGNARMYFQAHATAAYIDMYGNNSYLPMQINANPLSFMGGNVLIGTTTDSGFKFDVNGTGRFTGNVVLGTTALSGGGAAQWITANGNPYGGGFISSVSAVAKAYYYYDSGANAAVVQGSTGVGVQLLANNAAALTISSNQQAVFSSIVTSNDQFRVLASGNYRINNNVNGLLGYFIRSGAWKGNAENNLGFATDGPYGVSFFTNGTIVERLHISSAGNIMMNTTTSSTSGGFTNTTLLVKQVADGGAGGGIQIEASGSDNVAFFGFNGSAFQIGTSYRSTGSYQPIDFLTNGPVRMRLSTAGNLLIGTTTDAGYKLQVSGTATISGQYIQGGGAARSTNGSTIAFTGSSQSIWSANSDCGDGGRFLSIVNELGSTNAFSALSFRVNPGGGSNNAMLDMKFVNANSSNSSTLYWSFLHNGSFYDRMYLNSLGQLTATSFFESSDMRLKTLIDGSAQVAGIENLQAKLYEKNGKIELGYFAQDAEKLMPYAVTKNSDGFLNLSYREVHTAKIARLEQRVAELEKQLNLN